MKITDADVERYRRDGYLLIRGALTPDETELYHDAVRQLLAAWTPTGDSYEEVLYQLHLPWQQSADLAALTTHPRLADAARTLSGMPDVAVFLDQVICKPPGGAATNSHQDAPFLSFDDDRSLNLWIAFSDVTAANGALGYYRGSHGLGRLAQIHLDEADDLVDKVPALAGLPVDMLKMAPGDAVFHNCLTVHRATANTAGRPRLAYSIQYMSADARYNGYAHEHVDPYAPRVGDRLDFPCFARPGTQPPGPSAGAESSVTAVPGSDEARGARFQPLRVIH